MKIRFLAAALLLLAAHALGSATNNPAFYYPDQDLEELFHDVQMAQVFADSKTFVDYRPKRAPREIVATYRQVKSDPGFDLAAFVDDHFLPPIARDATPPGQFPPDMETHLRNQWDNLTRSADAISGITSLIPLPHAYVVPGGRFREIYYWDSYFTMLGLAESGRNDLIRGMLDNFSHLIDTLGFIPNGNRSYYLSRSQPPFFAAMVALYGEIQGAKAAAAYLPALEAEYAFWMRGAADLSPAHPVDRRVVLMPGGEILNRYYDDLERPRPESYREDVALARGLSEPDKKRLYRHIRAAAESGWDFSSRWFGDGQTFSQIETTDIIPVDLNALLYNLEVTLAALYSSRDDDDDDGADLDEDGGADLDEDDRAEAYLARAKKRKAAIRKYLWDPATAYFRDWNFARGRFTPVLSLAGAYPLFFAIATQGQAAGVAERLAAEFLFDGGFVTTLNQTGQQWDYPNGWAPLQWICIRGLLNYRQGDLAELALTRWLRINERVYATDQKMVEKYNVINTGLPAGGGEYPTQDGFGWTNGVALKLYAVRRSLAARDDARALAQPSAVPLQQPAY